MYEDRFMKRALNLSAEALVTSGTEPFGAVVVKDGTTRVTHRWVPVRARACDGDQPAARIVGSKLPDASPNPTPNATNPASIAAKLRHPHDRARLAAPLLISASALPSPSGFTKQLHPTGLVAKRRGQTRSASTNVLARRSVQSTS
jgi:hypothetical protein